MALSHNIQDRPWNHCSQTKILGISWYTIQLSTVMHSIPLLRKLQFHTVGNADRNPLHGITFNLILRCSWLTASYFFLGIYQFRVPESSKSGTPVGRIKATDRDIGKNAEMYFTIVSGDGMDMFDIFTDKFTQEGVITVSKVRRKGTYLGISSEGWVSEINKEGT